MMKILSQVYYRVYLRDGAVPSKMSSSTGDPFLGRIKATSVPPPHTAATVKSCLAAFEDIAHNVQTHLFLTLSSEVPMADTDKITIRDPTGVGCTPQQPLALVADLFDPNRSSLKTHWIPGGILARSASDYASESSRDTRYCMSVLYRFYWHPL